MGHPVWTRSALLTKTRDLNKLESRVKEQNMRIVSFYLPRYYKIRIKKEAFGAFQKSLRTGLKHFWIPLASEFYLFIIKKKIFAKLKSNQSYMPQQPFEQPNCKPFSNRIVRIWMDEHLAGSAVSSAMMSFAIQ